jgi:hypothetical protein
MEKAQKGRALVTVIIVAFAIVIASAVAYLGATKIEVTSQKTEVVKVPVAAQQQVPSQTQSVANQATANQEEVVNNSKAESSIVYTNNEYKFKITLPEAYRGYKADYSNKYVIVNFLIKTTDKNYAATGYYENSFGIIAEDANRWDNGADCADFVKNGKNNGTCYPKSSYLGRNNNKVFYYMQGQDPTKHGQEIINDFVDSGKLKQSFQLF